MNPQSANIVYDCGSSTGIHIVEGQIRENFHQGETINAVFISHFDRDHINGLPFLLTYCNVKNLFFPLITEESKKLILLRDLIYNSSSVQDFFTDFFTNPYNAFNKIGLRNIPHLYQILENNEDNEDSTLNNIDASNIASGKNISDIVFGSNDRKTIKWIYIPFNFRETERCSRLKAALANKLGKNYSCDDLLELAKKDSRKISEIKAAYKEVPGNFNTNSMTLLSAIEEDRIIQRLYRGDCMYGCNCVCGCNCMCGCNCCGNKFANGCLYTGDYDALESRNWKEFDDAYSGYYHYIGCIQIPHHGSRHNYNHKLLEIGNHVLYYIISAGKRNVYRHPSASVLKDILTSNKYPLIVNEYAGNTAHFIINY